MTTSSDPEIEAKIDELLAKMTLEEKVGQMNQYNGSWDVTGPAPDAANEKVKYDNIRSGGAGSMLNVTSVAGTMEAQKLAVENSRLGIPMVFAYDVIHGYQTMLPIPLGETASWDMEVLEKGARVAATEASAAGIHWTFAPMVDISRDARWGRVMEGSGEDPYLGSMAAVARVKGFQGSDLSATNTIAACAKHLAAYGYAEAGRDYNTAELSDNTLHNIVLPPFKAASDAGVATFMNSFNDINGIPATADDYLQREILKGKWGFDGMVISDWGSIMEMIEHGVAADKEHATKLAIAGGSDMDMESYCYINHLADAVEAGEVDEALIDDAVRRILRLKFKLGLFEDPYKYFDVEREKEVIGAAEHLEVARDAGRKSAVLLKNENQLLPLSKEGGTIAVIGPLADDKDSPLGSWRAKAIPNSAVSVLEGIKAAVGSSRTVVYNKGCELAIGERSFLYDVTINETDRSGIAEAARVASNADVVVLVVGEDCWQSGEARSRTDIGLPGVQQELVEAVLAANSNTVMVLMNGRPLELTWADENVPAILETWFAGQMAGHSIADVLFGDYNPSGRLPISFPRSVGQVPIYYARKNTGRPKVKKGEVFWSHYIDESNDPLYPFGYGLSYTNFEYSDLQVSAAEMPMDGSVEVSVNLSNNGSVAGKETVQLYIHDVVASTIRPIKELKGFQQITLEPGASQKVTFTLTKDDLAFYGRDKQWKAEPGTFKVFVGGNSRDLQETEFVLK